jgi:hypothetical protein
MDRIPTLPEHERAEGQAMRGAPKFTSKQWKSIVELTSYLEILDEGLDEMVRLCRREIVRCLLTGRIDAAAEVECLQHPSSLFEAAQLPERLEEILQVQAALNE